MAKDPAFLFYSSDFISGISDLTMEERGQYITLLCLQHQKGHLSKKIIDLSIGNATADVLHKFCIDENGLYYSKRLEIEINKRLEHTQKQRQRALDGWEKRKATADATAMPLEDENINMYITNTEILKIEILISECLKNENWILEIERVYKVDRTKIQFALNDFKSHCTTIGEDKPRSLNTFKKHFTNWVRIKKQYKNAG